MPDEQKTEAQGSKEADILDRIDALENYFNELEARLEEQQIIINELREKLSSLSAQAVNLSQPVPEKGKLQSELEKLLSSNLADIEILVVRAKNMSGQPIKRTIKVAMRKGGEKAVATLTRKLDILLGDYMAGFKIVTASIKHSTLNIDVKE